MRSNQTSLDKKRWKYQKEKNGSDGMVVSTLLSDMLDTWQLRGMFRKIEELADI